MKSFSDVEFVHSKTTKGKGVKSFFYSVTGRKRFVALTPDQEKKISRFSFLFLLGSNLLSYVDLLICHQYISCLSLLLLYPGSLLKKRFTTWDQASFRLIFLIFLILFPGWLLKKLFTIWDQASCLPAILSTRGHTSYLSILVHRHTI